MVLSTLSGQCRWIVELVNAALANMMGAVVRVEGNEL